MIITKLNGIGVLIGIAIISIFMSLASGSVFIDLNDLFGLILGHGGPEDHEILFSLRLPRTVSAFVTGALLALAGALMQILVRNPLADPYVLGISSGAAMMTLLMMLCGFSGLWLTTGAWTGSIMAMLMVFALAKKKSAWQSDHLLLTGIALASGFSAVISFILVMSPDKELHSMLFWLLGDLSYTHAPVIETGILIAGLMMSMSSADEFNILLRGQIEAQLLGVNTKHVYYKLYFISALLTATAVSLAGCIGFIGLIVPHMLRLLCSYDHRFLLPGCALFGGSLLTIADTLARTLFAPQQIPVGIFMAFIGIPLFLFLLQKKSA